MNQLDVKADGLWNRWWLKMSEKILVKYRI